MIYTAILLIGTLYLLINTYFVKVTTTHIEADIVNPFQFVHISDIHGSIRYINGSLDKIIDKLSPDFVVVTGDLSNTRKQLPKVLRSLSRIKAKYGIFIVLGNYEGQEIKGFYKRNTDIGDSIELIRQYKELTLLINEDCLLNVDQNKILIYGFDNSTYGKEKYTENIDLLDYDYEIILAHSPNIIKIVDKESINCDQVLAGHTHGGQISFLKNITLREYKDYHIGAKKHNNILFCINRGLGTVKIPFRINCFPEISMYRVSPKKA